MTGCWDDESSLCCESWFTRVRVKTMLIVMANTKMYFNVEIFILAFHLSDEEGGLVGLVINMVVWEVWACYQLY